MDSASLITRLAGFFDAQLVSPAWLVGGVVRDSLLGREIQDIDIAVPGDAQPLGRAVADFLSGTAVPLPEWNIVRVALPGCPANSCPFLIDISGHDGSIEDDLRSRDFTVDAMAIPLGCWDSDERFDAIVDPLNGRADLARRILRAGSDGVFGADPGRMLRAVRLAQQVGLRMEPDTARLIRRDANLLSRVSPERIRDEFMTILAADGARPQLEVLDRLDLLCRVIPELEATRHCEQPRSHHYWDVWDHLLHCVEYAEEVTAGHRNNAIYTMAPWTAKEDTYFAEVIGDGQTRRTVLKLAALLHDIAKPQTRAADADGRVRFLGHSEAGAEVVEHRLSSLRMSRRITDLVSVMVLHHLRPSQLRHGSEMPSPRAIFRYYRDVGDAAVDTLYLAMADVLAARGPELSPERWGNYARMIAVVLGSGAEQPGNRNGNPPLINGHDLMDALDLPPGPRIGSLLERLREAEAVGEISSRSDAIELAARLVNQGDLS
jgi:poly(A) polymerase